MNGHKTRPSGQAQRRWTKGDRMIDAVAIESRQQQILDELLNESDRGCILVGASVLDTFLEDLIKIKFSTKPHVRKHAVNPLFE